jgi:hypothetical protein
VSVRTYRPIPHVRLLTVRQCIVFLYLPASVRDRDLDLSASVDIATETQWRLSVCWVERDWPYRVNRNVKLVGFMLSELVGRIVCASRSYKQQFSSVAPHVCNVYSAPKYKLLTFTCSGNVNLRNVEWKWPFPDIQCSTSLPLIS